MGKTLKSYKIKEITSFSKETDILYSLGIFPNFKIKRLSSNIFKTSSIYEINNKLVILSNNLTKYIEVYD